MTMHPLLKKLSGGDRRSIGWSNEVVAEVIGDTKLFDVIEELSANGTTAMKSRGKRLLKV